MKVVSDEKGDDSHAQARLILKDRKLTSIQLIVFGFRAHQAIEVLDLSFNMITVIPDCLSSFKSLKQLDLSHNFIESFGTALSKMKNLSRLNLTKNRLRKVSSTDIYQLYFAKTVILSENLISEISECIRHLLNLRVLYLDGNPVMELPTELSKAKNLKELKIDWCEYLQPPHSSSITCSAILDKLRSVPLSSDRDSKVYNFLSLQKVFEFMQHLKEGLGKPNINVEEFIGKFSVQNKPVNLADSLLTALKRGHEGMALHYLHRHDIDSIDKTIVDTMTKTAVKADSRSAVCELVKYSTNVDWHINDAEECIVHWASDTLNADLIKTMISCNVQGSFLDKLGNTPIHRLLQKKSYRHFYFIHGFYNDSRSTQDNLISANSRFMKSSLASPKDLGMTSIPHTMPESDSYQLSFGKKLIDTMALLVKLGIDPNRYNTAGLCAWHLPIIKENYTVFMLLRNCEMPGMSSIDWQLGAYHGTLPIIHMAAKCQDWRFFLECVEGKMKVSVIEFDQRLRLPLDYLKCFGATVMSKLYIRYLKISIKAHLKSQIRIDSDPRSNLKRKASLLRKKLTTGSSVSQKSRQSTKSPSIRRLDPSLCIGANLKNFVCQSPKTKDEPEQPYANKIYSLHPKSGFLKFSSSNRSVKSEHGSSIHSTYSASATRPKAQDNIRAQHQSDEASTNQGFSGNAWMENMVGNMHAVRKSSKITLRKATNSQEPILIRQSLNLQIDKRSSFASIDDYKQPVMDRADLAPANITIEDVAENATVNKSRRIEVASRMSSLNTLSTPRRIEANNADKAIPKLSKIITKILLKDLIAFRYAVKSLTQIMTSEDSQNDNMIKHILMQLNNFFNKARLVLSAVSQSLSPDTQADLRACLKDELMHGGSMSDVISASTKLIKKRQVAISSQRRLIEISVIWQVNQSARCIFETVPRTISRLQSPRINVPGPKNFSAKARLELCTNHIPKPSLLRVPIKKVSIGSKVESGIKLGREKKKAPGQSLDISGDSLNLDMNLLKDAQISPKMFLGMNSEEKQNYSMRASRKNLLDSYQLPMKHFITDHDKGLRNLENKITGFRTGTKTDASDFGTTAIPNSSSSKKNLHVPATFGSIATRKLKTKLI